MTRLLIVTIALAAGAARADTPKPAPPPAAGSIKGTVIFEGEAPDRKKLKRDTDPFCAKTEKLDEEIVVDKGKLRDVLVRVKNGSVATAQPPATPVVIDQRECMYTPRVVGMIAGQKLEIRNSDGTFHNVRGMLSGKLLWNKPHPKDEPPIKLDPSAAKAGDVIEIVCDVHAWMKAWAVVQDHPYFAVTGPDGVFEITGLAPGTYTLEAWHPKLGLKTLTVKIGKLAKGNVTARFSYKAIEM
jgi:hypothetical protein